MSQISISEFLPFTPGQIYGLVADVDNYPAFLPWCVKTHVIDRQPDHFLAEFTVGVQGIREKFQTLSTLVQDKKMEINLHSGPFQHMNSTWKFTPVKGGTRVDFFMDFRFKSLMKEMIVGSILYQVYKQMIGAFHKQAISMFR